MGSGDDFDFMCQFKFLVGISRGNVRFKVRNKVRLRVLQWSYLFKMIFKSVGMGIEGESQIIVVKWLQFEGQREGMGGSSSRKFCLQFFFFIFMLCCL